MPLHARAKIGRNDPCRCGSGRKYKHCCIPIHTPSIDTLWARQHEDYARLTREMTRFAERKFQKQIYDAWQDQSDQNATTRFAFEPLKSGVE